MPRHLRRSGRTRPRSGAAAPAERRPAPAARRRRLRWGRLLLLVLAFGCVLGMAACADVVYQAASTVPSVVGPGLQLGATSELYDGSGQPVETLPTLDDRQPVALAQIPPLLQAAFVATEDRTFYTNVGISFRGIARAALHDVLHPTALQGASTISQQLARTLYLNRDVTISRKIREAILAVELNRRYSKTQILNMYLNDVQLGPNIRGVEAASVAYFDQPDLAKLSLADEALLAGLPQAPSGYDPLVHPGVALARRNQVLGYMLFERDITEAQYRAALAAPLGVTPPAAATQNSIGDYAYPWIVDAVISTLEQPPYNLSLSEIENGGLKIYTTFDPQLETQAVQAVQAHMNAIAPIRAGQPEMEAALVLMDQHDGNILAIVGGREHSVPMEFDRALQNKRQPGSSIKPIIDYIPAFENGLTAGTVVDDVIHAYPGGPQDGQYLPHDYQLPYYGLTTLTEAVRRSVNTVAVQVLNHIGISKGIANADAMGLDLTQADAYLPAAIGGISQKTCCSPLQMADAYSAIANGGMRVQPRLVTKVVAPDGQVLGSDPISLKQVVDPRVAYVMTKVLESVMSPTIYYGNGDGWDSNWGTGFDASVQDNVPDWPSAGKTGTTDNNTDLWFVGYTPLYTEAVWVGYDNQQVPVPNDAFGDTYAGPIWQKVMEDAVAGQAVVHFPRPAGVVEAPVDAKCAPWHVCSPSPLTPARWIQQDWFVAGTQPTPATSDNLWKQYQVTGTNPPLLWNPACGGTPVTRVFLDRTVLGQAWAEPVAYAEGTGDWQQFLPADDALAPPTASCTPLPTVLPPGAGPGIPGGGLSCAGPWTITVQSGLPAEPSPICVIQGQTEVLRFVSGDGALHQVALPAFGVQGVVPAGGAPLSLAVAPNRTGTFPLVVDGRVRGEITVAGAAPN